jgi:ketosteroid isomerase-like protein
MKKILFFAAYLFSFSFQSFSQSKQEGTDLAAIKQYFSDRDTNTVSPKSKYISAVKAVLKQYSSALEKLDISGTDNLFTYDSEIYESGASEGAYIHYMQEHLRPELKGLKSLKFNDYKVDVTIVGNYAFATETYNYVIVAAKDNAEVKHKGVTTSVLKKVKGDWKITVSHNSSRN